MAKKAEEERKKVEEERQKIIRKYAPFTTDELRIKLISLGSQIAGGWSGYGVGALIAKSIYDGKVKEREEIAMEIVRRGETLHVTPPSIRSQPPPNGPAKSGTGFFITDDGYLITNEHVVEGAQRIWVRTVSGELSASVVRLDSANDLALLRVEGEHFALPIRSSRSVRLGESVGTIGFPNTGLQGFSPKLTRGEISSLAGVQDDPREFQISLPVQPGNSGGALFDASGNVIGVVEAKLNQRAALAASGTLAENVNYAIKSSFLLGFLESVESLGPKLRDVQTGMLPFEDVVADVQKATVLVVVE